MSTSPSTSMPSISSNECCTLQTIESIFSTKQAMIETWLRKQWRLTPPPLTSSVDLRNSGFKIAPVDTNLFPAGYNNLNRDFLPLAIQAAQDSLEDDCPSLVRVLIIPENHTRNIFYYESLATLHEILVKSGFETRIGTLRTEVTSPQTIQLPSQRAITLEPVKREGNLLAVGDFVPCVILLNNDFADGVPDLLRGLEQPIRPPAELAWATRLKSQHFTFFQQVAEEFAALLNIDPWFINPLFRTCSQVDFMKREGEEMLVEAAAELLQAVSKKYKEHGITHKPFIMIKADAGSYGMGVMKIEDPEQIKNLNRKERTKMAISKGNKPINDVILQEGVYTFENWGDNNSSAEPVVYMLGHHVIGGFYRVHADKGNNENLNAPGMQFESLAFNDSCIDPMNLFTPDNKINRLYTYGVIARLALVAAARELASVKP